MCEATHDTLCTVSLSGAKSRQITSYVLEVKSRSFNLYLVVSRFLLVSESEEQEIVDLSMF